MSMNNLAGFRAKLEQHQTCIGCCVTLSDPAISELIGELGFDFTWIDGEHAPLNIETILRHIMALRASGAAPLVRVAWNQHWLIKPVLDLAPAAIIIPMVNSADEVRAAISACRYPPAGIRGCGPRRGTRFGRTPFGQYLEDSRQDPMVIVQFEHISALEHLDEILKIEELESVCIGPADFSGSMGYVNDPFRPEIAAILDDAAARIKAAGKYLGTATGADSRNLEVWKKRGADWIAVDSDWGGMAAGCLASLNAAQKAFGRQE